MKATHISCLGLALFVACASSDADDRPDTTVHEGGGAPGSGGVAPSTGGVVLGTGGTAQGGSTDPCLGAAPPLYCSGDYVASGPACGDAELNQDGEACDDGNSLPGDGCSGVCVVEPNFSCPTPGESCVSTIVCGDSARTGDEACDDANTAAGDGCSSSCMLEPGYYCPTPGRPCVPLTSCGDGRMSVGETCDDGGTVAGDGCSELCRIEDGYRCPRPNVACEPVPVCGDGALSALAGEQCDDGNSDGGDGCSATCRIEASYYDCSVPGELCTSNVVCGDGLVQGREGCDAANAANSDGCAEDCTLEPGWICRAPGRRCVPVCGDLENVGFEQCDDGNAASGDGCSATCTIEPGFACPTVGACHAPICGDGDEEMGEPCDDGNDRPFDGCYACALEPSCPGGVCASACGDGKKYDDEACDDGNTSAGDGCSATCELEDGFDCIDVEPLAAAATAIPVIYRDFVGIRLASGGPSAATLAALAAAGVAQHGDFNPDYYDDSSGRLGMVAEDLAADNTPELLWPSVATMTSLADFHQWYHDDPAANLPVFAALVLTPNGTGGYVFDSATSPNNRFDPLAGAGFVGAGIEPASGCGVAGSNVSFTTETHFWFEFSGGESFEFSGDDDVWVFVNGKLVVDLGDMHWPLTASFTLTASGDATVTQALITGTRTVGLGLVPGGVYEISLFHAERQFCGSNFKLTIRNFTKPRTECTPTCGDGVVTTYEECDEGSANTGAYGGCNGDCTLGPFCGDGAVSGPEECDDGANIGVYGAGVCAPGCRLPPSCGDGLLDPEEQCDEGMTGNDATYGGCNADCTLAPFCGDGEADDGEACDDGLNIGGYGYCAPGCDLGPRCGDAVLQAAEGETCDDGNDVAGDGCTQCGVEGYCGDGIVAAALGEICDDRVNDGSYGRCTPTCLVGPHCGDGVVQAEFEACDDGINDGGYGECAANCRIGPFCGDGALDPEHEECDDGNRASADGCSAACVNEVLVR